ncbi:hypothetical protein BP6252_12224 [Coleophoma cylindrospora]|uniref:P/Homo B domain-containing protein n=1 Tax=Coleophoma cylindrospora TaxID=1849047 RepID=A0A3D8QGJ4_9HELO|nr:hypothetical protein BP6252_12224 [Coleophoma cylindrospora]
MLSSILPTIVVLASLASGVVADCASFGIDFQDQGSYFLSSSDTSLFTAVTQFEGCAGTANVILVAPDESSWQCSDIATQPDDTNQMTTCPIPNNQLYTGSWTIIILDNNDANPSFTAMRTFNLVVGVQQTVTATPTGK